MNDETETLRANFEATISSLDPVAFDRNFSLERDQDGEYTDLAMHALWNGFLFGRTTREADMEAFKADADRWRWSVKHASWYRTEDGTHMAIPVAKDADLSSVGMRTDAVDQAMKAEKQG